MSRNKSICALIGAAILAPLATAASAAEPSKQEREEIFKAAGFKPKGDQQFVHCDEDVTRSYSPGRIEMADVNGDGTRDAWVTESSTFCYGNTAEFFVLVTPQAGGGWVNLLEAVGVPTPLSTKSKGWPDIEVGGPGFGEFPVYAFDGKKYVLKK
jgi:hypothetical protein